MPDHHDNLFAQPAASRPVEASYAACRRLCRRRARIFPADFVFCRPSSAAPWTPSMPSCDTATTWWTPPTARRREAALTQWRADLERSLQTSAAPVFDSPEAAALLPALADAVRRFHIPPEHLRAVLDGVEMDLRRPRYETFAALVGYCERVASAVGLACIHVWGFRGPEALGPARSAGIALQLTNILRDLKEDAAAGRVYLPLDDLRQCGYSVEQLQQGVTGAAFRRLVDLEVGRAEQFYRDGAAAGVAGPARSAALRHDDGHVSRIIEEDCPAAGRRVSAADPPGRGDEAADCPPLVLAAAASGRLDIADITHARRLRPAGMVWGRCETHSRRTQPAGVGRHNPRV